jgi:type VI secretion system secreted protein VgrG
MKNLHLILSAFVALAGFLPQGNAQGILNSASGFAVLGGSTVTSTGDTVLTGDLGVYSGTAITGFYPPGIVNGTTYAGGAVADAAQADVLLAYNHLAGESFNQELSGQDLGGLALTPGVYFFSSTHLGRAGQFRRPVCFPNRQHAHERRQRANSPEEWRPG